MRLMRCFPIDPTEKRSAWNRSGSSWSSTAGIQFDLEVVKAAIEGDVLEAHQAEIFLQKGEDLPKERSVEVQLKVQGSVILMS